MLAIWGNALREPRRGSLSSGKRQSRGMPYEVIPDPIGVSVLNPARLKVSAGG